MGQIVNKIFHVDVTVLQVLVEVFDDVKDLKMVEGVGEVLVGHELEQEAADVVVGVGRDLVLFVVTFLG
jgi:hypothetical protein